MERDIKLSQLYLRGMPMRINHRPLYEVIPSNQIKQTRSLLKDRRPAHLHLCKLKPLKLEFCQDQFALLIVRYLTF